MASAVVWPGTSSRGMVQNPAVLSDKATVEGKAQQSRLQILYFALHERCGSHSTVLALDPQHNVLNECLRCCDHR